VPALRRRGARESSPTPNVRRPGRRHERDSVDVLAAWRVPNGLKKSYVWDEAAAALVNARFPASRPGLPRPFHLDALDPRPKTAESRHMSAEEELKAEVGDLRSGTGSKSRGDERRSTGGDVTPGQQIKALERDVAKLRDGLLLAGRQI
jgi:hypothetical protein